PKHAQWKKVRRNSRLLMSDYIVDLADVSTYGCDPMSFEELREEFEGFPFQEDGLEGPVSI
ncbi:hypothetical protein, partial [Rhizobium sp. PDO1-076]|uniref:hypothetical protein n=1 Tax=Rhizobium sp. PDO1-076 TaxID=1125979 RepID=UPI001AEBA70C